MLWRNAPASTELEETEGGMAAARAAGRPADFDGSPPTPPGQMYGWLHRENNAPSRGCSAWWIRTTDPRRVKRTVLVARCSFLWNSGPLCIGRTRFVAR
jgi:hypothetical protein